MILSIRSMRSRGILTETCLACFFIQVLVFFTPFNIYTLCITKYANHDEHIPLISLIPIRYPSVTHMKKSDEDYVSVSLPADLIREVDQKAVGRQGYRDYAEFINDAIRRLLDELERKDARSLCR